MLKLLININRKLAAALITIFALIVPGFAFSSNELSTLKNQNIFKHINTDPGYNTFSIIDSSVVNVIEDSSEVSVTVLPFSLYSEIFKYAVGGFIGIEGLTSGNGAIYSGGLISTNGTKYGFIQFRNFYLPFFPRIYVQPDLLGGYFGILRVYKSIPGSTANPATGPPAGSNESDKNNYLEVSGSDQWYELKIRYLLPIGQGKDNVIFNPVFYNGNIFSEKYEKFSWNPLKGRTFLDLKPFYRKRVNFTTAGAELALTNQNSDHFSNPSKGSFIQLAYRRDWGGFGSSAPWSVISSDWRIYLPLNDNSNKIGINILPKVLALNIWTANTLTWNSFDVIGTNTDGTPQKLYHRPPPYTGAYLGGRYHMRAFYEGRFSDRAAIYYGAEYRQIVEWNPFNLWSVTRNLKIHSFQIAVFGELGRVSPVWSISELHKNMKWDVGAGIRFMLGQLVLRMDAAYSTEGVYTQMYVDHAF